MKNNNKKLKLVEEALDSWHKGELSTNATMVVMRLIVNPQPKLTKKTIEYGRKLAKEYRKEKDGIIR